MPTGTVKFYNEKNKFGFIKVDDTGQEIYVAASGLTEPVKNDDRVEFEIQEAKKGPVAVMVKKISG
ncbi:MAG: cold-shock protein [Bacteroidota bacterium]